MLRSVSARIIPQRHGAVLAQAKDVAIRDDVDVRTHGRLPALRAVGEKKGIRFR
jgi:hypothetical protein